MNDMETKILVKQLTSLRKQAERVVSLWVNLGGNPIGNLKTLVSRVDRKLSDKTEKGFIDWLSTVNGAPYEQVAHKIFEIYQLDRIAAHFASNPEIQREVKELRGMAEEYFGPSFMLGPPPQLEKLYARKGFGARAIEGCESLYMRAWKEGFRP